MVVSGPALAPDLPFQSTHTIATMPNSEDRLTQLEIKASYTEDLLDKLDAIIIRQQGQIDRMVRELQQLRQTSVADGGPTERQLRDELPPHY